MQTEKKRPETLIPIRYLLVSWLLVLSAVAYLDRTNISIAGIQIGHEFAISNKRLGWIFSAFLIGYAVFQVPAASVVTAGERRSVWIAGRDGTAELRQVAIIDASDDALVSDGLRVGDQVIVDPPVGLYAGARIALAP